MLTVRWTQYHVVSRILEKLYRRRTFLATFFLCCYEFLYWWFLIYSQTIRNFTPTARYLLQIHSILVTHCKITRYLLQKWLVVKNESLLVATVTSYCCRRNVTCSKLWPSLIEEIARCKRSLATSCEIPLCLLQKMLIVKNHSLLVAWNFYQNRNNK